MSQILVVPCPRYVRYKNRSEINLGMAFCQSSPSLHQPTHRGPRRHSDVWLAGQTCRGRSPRAEVSHWFLPGGRIRPTVLCSRAHWRLIPRSPWHDLAEQECQKCLGSLDVWPMTDTGHHDQPGVESLCGPAHNLGIAQEVLLAADHKLGTLNRLEQIARLPGVKRTDNSHSRL